MTSQIAEQAHIRPLTPENNCHSPPEAAILRGTAEVEQKETW